MVSITETCILQKRKSFIKNTINMNDLDDNILLRHNHDNNRTVSFSIENNKKNYKNSNTNYIYNVNDNDGQQINNIHQITSILDKNYDNTLSYTTNDLWRLNNFTIINQVQTQRHSFLHRNINKYNENDHCLSDVFILQKEKENENEKQEEIQEQPHLQRSKSFQQTSNNMPFRRESIIRQSWNNLWRKNKDKTKDKVKIFLLKESDCNKDDNVNINNDDADDVNVNDEKIKQNKNSGSGSGSGSGSSKRNSDCGISNDINILEKVVIKAKDSLISMRSRHSRNNSSSSSCSSYRSTSSIGLGIRSAPSTPMSPLQGQSEQHLSTTSQGQSAVSLNTISRSPSHSSTKSDSKSVKQLSSGTPPSASSSSSTTGTLSTTNNKNAVTLHPGKSKDNLQIQTGGTGITGTTTSDKDKEPKEKKRKELSSSRQKKFHRHFQQVALDEKVINYFSCALVSDILLQGHLYITDNYFAFYSNVFGYVTKLLIPTVSVVKISKEKTGKIFPNAVGVATSDERHVFGSFMSREAAFRLMISVWRPIEEEPEIEIIVKLPDFEVSSIEDDSSCSVSGNESPPRIQNTMTTTDVSSVVRTKPPLVTSTVDGVAKLVELAPVILKEEVIKHIIAAPPKNVAPSPKQKFEIKFPTDIHIVYLGVILAIILTLFSGFLLYRIQDIQARTSGFSSLDFKLGTGNDIDVYAEVLRWQKEMQAKSAEEAQIILNSNLEQIARVRKSLETLSILIHDKNSPFVQSATNSPLDTIRTEFNDPET